ncbi:hypothetical protein F2P81_009926 [Scophthalmus maximus]|uniref:Uncharacterized protein n=1 Tax=Scophthalmus maximus TaxID=52904 RepID=A0A6A4T4E9_SCOMX|nr:hypothetical protein F2P81_009926 [Scophthalmus maximus]
MVKHNEQKLVAGHVAPKRRTERERERERERRRMCESPMAGRFDVEEPTELLLSFRRDGFQRGEFTLSCSRAAAMPAQQKGPEHGGGSGVEITGFRKEKRIGNKDNRGDKNGPARQGDRQE